MRCFCKRLRKWVLLFGWRFGFGVVERAVDKWECGGVLLWDWLGKSGEDKKFKDVGIRIRGYFYFSVSV